MGVHGDDIVRTIREALADERFSAQAPMQTGVRITPNAERDGWQRRDGRLEFECVGRDSFRGFRITVEVIDPELVYAADDLSSDEWVVAGEATP